MAVKVGSRLEDNENKPPIILYTQPRILDKSGFKDNSLIEVILKRGLKRGHTMVWVRNMKSYARISLHTLHYLDCLSHS